MTAAELALASVEHTARFRISEAAADARKLLPLAHPARQSDSLTHTTQDARDEALARAWFQHLAGLKEE